MKNKFKLLNQNDSVYKDWWVEISIERDQWNKWGRFCISRSLRVEKWIPIDTDIETRWDLDECSWCGIISIEHLQNYFKWATTIRK